MNPTDVVLLASLIFAFGLISKRLDGTVLTPPMVFVGVGLLVGSSGLGLLHFKVGEGTLHILAELTLILVLFGDATRIDVRTLRRELGLPVRLLGIGLPLSMAVGAGLALLVLPDLTLWEAATLGAILAPTDAALGQAVVSSPLVPLRIRQGLNVESGLNDGIALPFVLVFMSLASMSHGESRTPEEWVVFAALQVTLGPLIGFLIAWVGGYLVARAATFGYIEESFERIAGLALALLCYAAAELAGGNGFIAAFVGGVTIGNTQRERCRWMLAFLEAEGQLFMLMVFLGLGASLAVPAMSSATGPVVLYALLSLTLVRMVPVSISLIGTKLRLPSHLFIGWFGPRGLASILYGILLLSEATTPHEDAIFHVVVVTALLSVFLHGLTASPGVALYSRATRTVDASSAEFAPVTEQPVRRRHG